MGRSYRWMSGVRRAVAVAIVMAGLTGAPGAALAAVGDVIRTVNLPACPGLGGHFCLSGVGTSIAVVPGASVGLPQEPILLVTSCDAFGSEAEQAQASKLWPAVHVCDPIRPSLQAQAMLIPWVQPLAGESATEELVRFRTIGDMTCTGAIPSQAQTLPEILEEVQHAQDSERGGRADDKRNEAAMEDRKRLGYF